MPMPTKNSTTPPAVVPASPVAEAADGAMSTAPAVSPAAPAAAASTSTTAAPEPERRSPEAWAAAKGTADWALAATRARHQLADGPERVGWLTNGTLTEEAYDAALDATLNGELR